MHSSHVLRGKESPHEILMELFTSTFNDSAGSDLKTVPGEIVNANSQLRAVINGMHAVKYELRLMKYDSHLKCQVRNVNCILSKATLECKADTLSCNV